jgi:hypothetical protein
MVAVATAVSNTSTRENFTKDRDMAKCRLCEREATIRVTDVVGGKPQASHYCNQHGSTQLGEEFWGQVAGPFSWADFGPVLIDRLKPVLKELGLSENQLRTSAAVPAYRRLLQDQDWRVRYTASVWLGYLGLEAADAADDLRAAQQDENEQVRRASETALERIQKPTR